MRKIAAALLAYSLLLGGCTATQRPSSTDETEGPPEKIYIPTDLNDCFVQLEKLLKPEDLEKMRVGTEGDMNQYHFGLGMWMRNNWGLWGGSRLAKWFNAQGIQHPDDMSGIILDSFWRHLNQKPIELDEQVKYYQDYWKKLKAGQLKEPGDKK